MVLSILLSSVFMSLLKCNYQLCSLFVLLSVFVIGHKYRQCITNKETEAEKDYHQGAKRENDNV